MSFDLLFSLSLSSGSGSGSGIGSSGSGFYSYSESYAGQNQATYAAEYSTGSMIWIWFLQTAALTIVSIIVMFTGNAVLKDHHHGHLSRADTASVAAIGPVFITLLYIVLLAVFCFLLGFAFFRKIVGCFASIRRNRYFSLLFEPIFVAFIGALDGAVGGSLLYVFKLPKPANARLQPIAILHATEAGMIGASVLLGGFYALIVLGALLFLGPKGLFQTVCEFFCPPKPQVRSAIPPQQQSEDSLSPPDPRIAEAEV